jgi:hypothetical protein
MVVSSCGDAFEPSNESASASSGGGSGGQTSVSSSSGRGGSGGATCVDLGEPCTECELRECAAEYCECYGNVACGLVAGCVFACSPGDAGCYQSCYTQYPDGITDGALLSHCAAVHCEPACGDLIELSGCQLCIYRNCETAMNKCIANPACSNLLYCLDACGGNTTCENNCYTTYPNGVSDVAPVGSCSQEHCTVECELES